MPGHERPIYVTDAMKKGDNEAVRNMASSGGIESAKWRSIRKEISKMEAEALQIELYLLALKNNEHLTPVDDNAVIQPPTTEREINELREKYKQLTGKESLY